MTSFIKDEISRPLKVEIYQATLLWFTKWFENEHTCLLVQIKKKRIVPPPSRFHLQPLGKGCRFARRKTRSLITSETQQKMSPSKASTFQPESAGKTNFNYRQKIGMKAYFQNSLNQRRFDKNAGKQLQMVTKSQIVPNNQVLKKLINIFSHF